MRSLLFLLIPSVAHANSVPVSSGHIVEVGQEVKWEIGGAWARVFPNAPTSDLFFAAGGDFWRIEMDGDLNASDVDRISMTARQNLDDHSIVPCPNGDYLHIASGKTSEPNDSAYSFMYDSEFRPIEQSVLAESVSKIKFNDMAVICHEKGRYASFIDFDVWGTVIYTFDEYGAYADHVRMPDLPLPEGGTLLEDPIRGDLALVTSTPEKDGLYVSWLDWDLTFKETQRILQVDRELTQSYWPQAVKIIEDRIVIAYVQQPANEGFIADWGNIWLAIFDTEWRLLENHQITLDEAPDGTMRPGLALQGDQLWLTYDEIEQFPPGVVQPRIVPITLNLEAFDSPDLEDTSSDSGDSGATDTADTGGSGPSKPEGCGCASKRAPLNSSWVLPGLLLVLSFRSRRSTLFS